MRVDAVVDVGTEEVLERSDGRGRVDCWDGVGLAGRDVFSWHELNPELDFFGISDFVIGRIGASVCRHYVRNSYLSCLTR